MREQPSQDNHAAVRVHESLEMKVKANPNPPRSEIIDMMVQEAMNREQELDAIKAEKSPKGLRAAQRKPVIVQAAAVASSPVPVDNTTDLSFFENLLAPSPASMTEPEDYINDD